MPTPSTPPPSYTDDNHFTPEEADFIFTDWNGSPDSSVDDTEADFASMNLNREDGNASHRESNARLPAAPDRFWYAVFVGRRCGVFSQLWEAEADTRGIPEKHYQRYRSCEDAECHYAAALAQGAVVIVGNDYEAPNRASGTPLVNPQPSVAEPRPPTFDVPPSPPISVREFPGAYPQERTQSQHEDTQRHPENVPNHGPHGSAGYNAGASSATRPAPSVPSGGDPRVPHGQYEPAAGAMPSTSGPSATPPGSSGTAGVGSPSTQSAPAPPPRPSQPTSAPRGTRRVTIRSIEECVGVGTADDWVGTKVYVVIVGKRPGFYATCPLPRPHRMGRKKDGNAPAKAGRKPWASGTKLTFLETRKPLYQDAVASNAKHAVGDFYDQVTRQWIIKYGFDLPMEQDNPDAVDPDDAQLATFKPNITGNDEASRARSKTWHATRERLAAWFRHHSKKKLKDDAAEPENSVLNATLKPPKRPAAWQLYMNLHYASRVKPTFEAELPLIQQEAVDTGKPAPHAFNVKMNIARHLYSNESEEFRRKVERQVDETHEHAVAEYNKLKQRPREPADYQRAILFANSQLQPLVDSAAERYGMVATLLLVGPVPDNGGDIGVFAIHSGKTEGLLRQRWNDFDKNGFSSAASSIARFTQVVFPESVHAQQAIPGTTSTGAPQSEPTAGPSNSNMQGQTVTHAKTSADANGASASASASAPHGIAISASASVSFAPSPFPNTPPAATANAAATVAGSTSPISTTQGPLSVTSTDAAQPTSTNLSAHPSGVPSPVDSMAETMRDVEAEYGDEHGVNGWIRPSIFDASGPVPFLPGD
ncbi:hypothetical protein DENSPDRAFT_886350 [Dentipellis sp. KUC8613]|nr:hypothetical protein DENSPDRAFT_886350 [Dentipellis sp. KUC8613]